MKNLAFHKSPDFAQLRFLQGRKIGRKAMAKQATPSGSAHTRLG
jgi:hypothetical protein